MSELKILFVDDEPAVLDGIRGLLRKDRQRWQASFVESGAEALEALGRESFDVLVTDMLMPKMDGAELLRLVRDQYPSVARIVLSGHADLPAVTRALPLAQQYLAKPCEGPALRSVIERAQSIRSLMTTPTLVSMVGGLGHLPTAPSIFLQLCEAASDPDVGMAELASILEQDPALSAKVLQVANSSFFSLAVPARTVAQATSHLGAETIRAITLSAHVEQAAQGKLPKEMSLEGHQRRSFTVATLAKAFSSNHKEGEQAFTVGVIQDLGAIVLGIGAPKDAVRHLKAAKASGRPIEEHERESWGVSHAEVGAYLLGTWGLPATVVDLVRTHHHPRSTPEDSRGIAAALHVADIIVETANHPDERLDWDFLAEAGMASKLASFQETAERVLSLGGGSSLERRRRS